ncbi:hypothetical protein N9B14_02605 [Akkermansiaceae bacterium]|nr:hypothetical protein [Akkermansiaceae bacterium]
MKEKYFGLAALLTCSASAALLADFDGNGSFTEAAFKGAPIGSVVEGGPTGSYYNLLNNIGDAGNHLAFPATGTSGWQFATLSMDIRAANVQADGFGIAFVDVATHGADLVRSGAGGLNDAEERAAYTNSVGVGFRTFNGTNATVNYNGAESADAAYNLPQGEWIPVEISMVRDGAGAAISASINGESVFSDYALAGAPDDFRVQIAGRTGGSAMSLDIDNVDLTTSAIPEPTAALLGFVGLLGLAARRRR